jgi:hypothetical protein
MVVVAGVQSLIRTMVWTGSDDHLKYTFCYTVAGTRYTEKFAASDLAFVSTDPGVQRPIGYRIRALLEPLSLTKNKRYARGWVVA